MKERVIKLTVTSQYASLINGCFLQPKQKLNFFLKARAEKGPE
jgi:hypothetical protein